MKFKDFVKDYNTEHITSSHYHEGNGLAGTYVEIVKDWLQKAKGHQRRPLQINAHLPDYTNQQQHAITTGTPQQMYL